MKKGILCLTILASVLCLSLITTSRVDAEVLPTPGPPCGPNSYWDEGTQLCTCYDGYTNYRVTLGCEVKPVYYTYKAPVPTPTPTPDCGYNGIWSDDLEKCRCYEGYTNDEVDSCVVNITPPPTIEVVCAPSPTVEASSIPLHSEEPEVAPEENTEVGNTTILYILGTGVMIALLMAVYGLIYTSTRKY